MTNVTNATAVEVLINNSLSCVETGYCNRCLMAENSVGQKAYYCIPNDGSPSYREVTGVNNYHRTMWCNLAEITPPSKFLSWEGYGYTGGHNSQSYWNTSQQDEEMFSLISSGYIVLDKTTEGNVSGYYPKVIYWQDEQFKNIMKKKQELKFRDDKNNRTLQKVLNK